MKRLFLAIVFLMAPALCLAAPTVSQLSEEGADLFEDSIIKQYPWALRYSADEYVALLGVQAHDGGVQGLLKSFAIVLF